MTVDLRQLETTEARLIEFLRHMTAIAAAATAVGLVVGGIGSRLFMLVARLLAPERIGLITENGNRVGEVTFGGTVALLIFVGLPTAMAIGVLGASSEPWLRWSGRVEGLVLGLLLLAVFSPMVIDPENFDFFVLGHQPANLAMIIGLFVAGGVGTVWLRGRLLSRLPRRTQFGSVGAIYALVASFGLFALMVSLGLLGFGGGTGERVLVALLVLGLAAAALVDWTTKIRDVPRPRLVGVAGYGTLLVLAAVTIPRLLADVADIVP